jgi:hypothetical protein
MWPKGGSVWQWFEWRSCWIAHLVLPRWHIGNNEYLEVAIVVDKFSRAFFESSFQIIWWYTRRLIIQIVDVKIEVGFNFIYTMHQMG